MDDEIDRAILLLVSTLTRTTPADSVMKITQSAYNLAQAKNILAQIEEAKPRRGRPPKVVADEA